MHTKYHSASPHSTARIPLCTFIEVLLYLCCWCWTITIESALLHFDTTHTLFSLTLHIAFSQVNRIVVRTASHLSSYCCWCSKLRRLYACSIVYQFKRVPPAPTRRNTLLDRSYSRTHSPRDSSVLHNVASCLTFARLHSSHAFPPTTLTLVKTIGYYSSF